MGNFCHRNFNIPVVLQQNPLMLKNRHSRVHTSLQADYPPKHSDDQEKVIFSQQNTESLLPPIADPKLVALAPIQRFKQKLDMMGETQNSQDKTEQREQLYTSFQSKDFEMGNMHRLVNLSETPRQGQQRYQQLPRRLKAVSRLEQTAEQSYEQPSVRIQRPRRHPTEHRRRESALENHDSRYYGRYRTEQQELPETPNNKEEESEQYISVRRQKYLVRQARRSVDEAGSKYVPPPAESNALAFNYSHASFAELWRAVPRQLHNRTEENMRHFAFRCHKMNPLLKKLEYVTVVEMLKVYQLGIYEKNELIYSKDKRPNSSYIIFWGKVSLVDNQTKSQTAYEMGETLHEDYLLEYRRYELKTLHTAAIAVQPSGLLELNHKNLVMLKTELMDIGLKSDLQILESEFRKNYLTKLSLRQTFRAKHRSSIKHSQYY